MKLLIFYVCIGLCVLLSISVKGDAKTNLIKNVYCDATEEINQYDREFEQKEKEAQQLVFGAFATMAQNLFNIVQNPNNPTNVAKNVAEMIASIINTGMTIMRNLPHEITVEERQKFISEIMTSLELELKKLGLTKSRLAA